MNVTVIKNNLLNQPKYPNSIKEIYGINSFAFIPGMYVGSVRPNIVSDLVNTIYSKNSLVYNRTSTNNWTQGITWTNPSNATYVSILYVPNSWSGMPNAGVVGSTNFGLMGDLSIKASNSYIIPAVSTRTISPILVQFKNADYIRAYQGNITRYNGTYGNGILSSALDFSGDAFSLLAIFPNRSFSNSEALSLISNPWQIFKPNKQLIYFNTVDIRDKTYITANSATTAKIALNSVIDPKSSSGQTINIRAKSSFANTLGVTLNQEVTSIKNTSIVIPKIWNKQPQYPIEVDWSNPLTKYLEIVYLPIDKVIFKKGTKYTPPYSIVNTYNSIGKYGIQKNFNGFSGSSVLLPSLSYPNYLGARVAALQVGNGADASISGTGTNNYSFCWRIANGTDVQIRTASGVLAASALNSVTVGEYCTLGALVLNSVDSYIYKNGFKIAQASSGNPTINSANHELCSNGNTSSRGNHSIALYLAFSPGVSNIEMEKITANPWQIFKPIKKVVYSSSSEIKNTIITARDITNISTDFTTYQLNLTSAECDLLVPTDGVFEGLNLDLESKIS